MSQSFNASWTQGNSLVVENPEPGVDTSHYGWGTVAKLQPGVSQWFHIPLPTPVIVNYQRSRLSFTLQPRRDCKYCIRSPL
jgi:hypothetical protein